MSIYLVSIHKTDGAVIPITWFFFKKRAQEYIKRTPIPLHRVSPYYVQKLITPDIMWVIEKL